MVRIIDGKERAYWIEYGFRKVKIPGIERQLGLVVVKGLGKEPMMLLTTEPVRRKWCHLSH